jgi:hypothetical protein
LDFEVRRTKINVAYYTQDAIKIIACKFYGND